MRKLKKMQELQISTFDNVSDGVVFLDTNWRYIYMNEAAGRLFNVNPPDIMNQDIRMPDQNIQGVPFHTSYEEAAHGQVQQKIHISISDGSRWLENRIYPSKMGLLLIFVDITDSKEVEMKSREIERSNLVLLDNLPGLAYHCRYDRDWTMLFVSQGCYELTGYQPEQLLFNRDLSFNDLISPEYRDKLWNVWTEVLPQKVHFRQEYTIVKADGEVIWVLEQAQGIYSDNGEVESIEGLVINIDDRKKRELEVEYLLEHDYLTGAFNRIHFEQEANRLDIPHLMPISIITGDINGLKLINDAFGHEQGDSMIKETAFLLGKFCRKGDVLGRIGGDEFGILLPHTDAAAADAILLQIIQSFERYNKTVSNEMIRINISFGSATKDMADINIHSVIKLAEENMFKHKLLERKSLHSAIVNSIKTTMFAKSQETEEHAERLAHLTRILGKKLSLPLIELNELELLATLHDIGKVGISDQILNKPGKLTDDEWELMKEHSEIGYRIAMSSPELMPVADFILSHHERWDGLGYPQGLAGVKIPLASRILAVADSFDAMTQDRSYRKAMPFKEALEEIARNRGTQFDPAVADTFLLFLNENRNDFKDL